MNKLFLAWGQVQSGFVKRPLPLADFMEFNCKRFFDVLDFLIGAEASMRSYRAGSGGDTDPMRTNLTVDGMSEELFRVASAIEGLKLKSSHASLQRAIKSLEAINRGENQRWVERGLIDDIRELRNNLSTELSGVYFLALDEREAKSFSPSVPLFGRLVDDAFPSSASEISEAGRCLAVGLHTACVVHLMRALETPLNLMAARLGVDQTISNWNTLLNRLEAEVRNSGQSSSSLTLTSEEKAFFAEAISLMFNIKNAWRNHAAHANRIYSQHDAAQIFDTVKGIMTHLAQHLSEQGYDE